MLGCDIYLTIYLISIYLSIYLISRSYLYQISFENVHLPKSSMLNKYADIIDNKYVQTIKGMPIFHMVGQRLFTGRIVVAQGAIEFRKKLFAMTEVYANNKFCWSPSGNEVPLSSLPQLKSLFNEEKTKTKRIEKFIAACELELTQHLKNNSLPDLHLVEAIAAIKVFAILKSCYFNLTFLSNISI